jgi:radical SAM superfamily enzyme YgiQ (UPF0313 family)
MKKAGFRKLILGIESASERTIDILDKSLTREQIVEGCKMASSAGLQPHLTMMVGYPWETRDDAVKTLDLARDLMARGDAEMLQSTVVVPYPGTPLFREAVERGWIRFKPVDSWERYDMTEPVLSTPDMEPEEIMKMCSDIYKSFITPRFIMRQIMNIRNIEDINYVMRGGRAVLGHIFDFARIRS